MSDFFETGDDEGFDLDKYLRVSGGSRPEIFDWNEKGPRLEDEALFCLGYMLDVEAHTIVYLRELLATSVLQDASITAFLTCWNFDEFLHSQLLRRFLATQGVDIVDARFSALRRQHAGDSLVMLGARALSRVTGHFVAVHMTWGAINELIAVESYRALARRCAHPLLDKILTRIVKDERRHFAFYFAQAKERLKPKAAQRLARVIIGRLWSPVGQPLRGQNSTARMYNYLFADSAGQHRVKTLDAIIARLPGFEWFDLMSGYRPAMPIAGMLTQE